VRETLHRHGYLVDELTYTMILDAANLAAVQGMQTFSRNVEGVLRPQHKAPVSHNLFDVHWQQMR